MPNYTPARTFDIVRTIREMKRDIRTLQMQMQRISGLYLHPSGDITGVRDTANINGVLGTAGRSVTLLPGTWYTTGIQLTHLGCELAGFPGTVLVPGTGISGPMITLNAKRVGIRNMRLYGGTDTRTNNPAADVVSVGTSALRWSLTDLDVTYCNGNFATLAASGASHGVISRIQGTNNAGGVRVTSNVAGTNRAAQVLISDYDMQQFEVSESIYLQDVTDILVQNVDSSCMGTAAVPTIHVAGRCQTCQFLNIDVGVQGAATTGIPVLKLEATGGFSPTEVFFTNGKFQQGGVGIVVNDACARIGFAKCVAANNLGDGWQFNGTGAGIHLSGCQANINNQGAGTAYDVNVTSTAHVGLFEFAYVSTGVTARLNITQAGNHVSDTNFTNPGGLGTAGNAPAGW